MEGICRKGAGGETTHVRVKDDNGGLSWMTVEEYTDQDIAPPVAELPECADD